MKELTYEDWQKNPTPREMWVWDDCKEDKRRRRVIYISKETYPIVSINLDAERTEHYKHCAEIGEQRKMTNKELSRWLRENPTREYKYINDNYIFSYHEYKEGCEEEEVSEKIRIRENYGEWQSPIMEKKYE